MKITMSGEIVGKSKQILMIKKNNYKILCGLKYIESYNI